MANGLGQWKGEVMIGKQIGEETGQVTSMRVLPFDGPATKMDVSFQAQGRLLDCDVNETGSYVSLMRPDGTLFGEGQGVQMGSDGSFVRWIGQGSGRMTAPGRVSWRGAIHYSQASGKLATLNGTCAAFEYETDESGKTEARLWEWT